MPKQNRPLVRDGRIQGKKKRTDRSYLRPEATPAPVETVSQPESAEADAREAAEVVRDAIGAAAEPAPTATLTPPPPAEAPAPPPARTSGKLPTAIRAIQQQGVRKRRELDVQALAVRDTKYALHELRRIAILATMVVVTLVVLALVLH